MLRVVRSRSYFDLLGVSQDSSKRDLKRSYFKLSKDFHPDRFYGKDTGSFRPWLAEIFETIRKAFDVLSDRKHRDEYLRMLKGAPKDQSRAQTKEEHAAELFERAIHEEAHGNVDQAMVLYRAVARMDPRARYLRRAARCLLGREPGEAEDLARRARELRSEDPSYYRVHAETLRALGRLPDAEEVLVAALALKSENDVLLGELQADLKQVRAQLKDA
jgi:curved DNA-binding protein CbpA